MASYWKSNPRYFCDICKCWLADNKASIEFHERGKSHNAKKEKHLSELRKRSAESFKNQQQAGNYLRQMEDAALQAYKKDLAAQGLNIDGEMPQLAASRPSTGLHEYHQQEPAGKKRKNVKIHNIDDLRESKIVKNSPWVKQISPEGEEYYWNTETSKSQWVKPKELVNTEEKTNPSSKISPVSQTTGKSSWQKQVSPDGQMYYWNSESGKTQWDKPDGFNDKGKEVKNPPKKSDNSLDSKSSCPWTEEISPEGHTYYWNSETGKSRWEKPDDYVEPKLSFVPVNSDDKEDSSGEAPPKKPKHNPYGSWSTVRVIQPKKQVDWQLPAKPENAAEQGLVDRTSLEQPPEPTPQKFNEKIITSLGGGEGSTTFKKKTAKQRSIRKRNNDD